jgi:hypothetical protein
MDVKESTVHALYKNEEASDEFIEHCLKLTQLYTSIIQSLPDSSDIFTRSEINRFTQFPKNRPDLYIRTSYGKEAIVNLVDDKQPYIIRKQLDEIIAHSENEGWEGDYPRICFVLKDASAKNSLLYTTRKKLESMGFDDNEIVVLAVTLEATKVGSRYIWSDAMAPQKSVTLFG